jgi:hypothetical protein
MRPKPILILMAGAALAAAPSEAQSLERRAVLTGGSASNGRCSAEVVVDGAADVEIRGDMGTLRNLAGQMPEWRRFECTSAIPPMAANMEFRGEGRGDVRMVSTPYNNNGVAVVHIDDRSSGANIYRFSLTWNGEGPSAATAVRPETRRIGADQALEVCQEAIRRQAVNSYGASRIVFLRTSTDNTPGRSDWVIGMLQMRRPDGTEERRRFSCSLNLQSGEVRSSNIEAGEASAGSANRDMTAREMDACRQAVADRMRSDGFSRVDFGEMNMESRYSKDWITGTARAAGGVGPQSFDFSCSVTPGTGDVISTQVRQR